MLNQKELDLLERDKSQSNQAFEEYIYIYIYIYTELGRLLTNCNLLLIPDYMKKIVVSNVICYITHFR